MPCRCSVMTTINYLILVVTRFYNFKETKQFEHAHRPYSTILCLLNCRFQTSAGETLEQRSSLSRSLGTHFRFHAMLQRSI